MRAIACAILFAGGSIAIHIDAAVGNKQISDLDYIIQGLLLGITVALMVFGL